MMGPLQWWVASVVQSLSCVRLCATPMDCSTAGLPVPHHLLEFAQVHVHCIGDAIQPSHPLTPSSPLSTCLLYPLTCQLHWGRGLPWWLNGKSTCNAEAVGDVGSIPESGRSPGDGNGNPLSILAWETHGQRSLAGYSPWGCKESDTDWLSMHSTHTHTHRVTHTHMHARTHTQSHTHTCTHTLRKTHVVFWRQALTHLCVQWYWEALLSTRGPWLSKHTKHCFCTSMFSNPILPSIMIIPLSPRRDYSVSLWNPLAY